MSHRNLALMILVAAACSFLAGVWYKTKSGTPKTGASAGPRILRYICPMHPQYVSDRPGTAPCCGMRLEPVYERSGFGPTTAGTPAFSLAPGAVLISPEKKQIADLSRIWVPADLFEHESRFVRPGQPAKVIYQGRSFQAGVSDILPQFNPESRTLMTRLEMANPGYA